jgi:NAD(P)-dependent dehydrogenase (short-subunit alcohol dehydrogenase family)
MVISFPWDDLTWSSSWYNGMSAYSISKLANVLFTVELAEKLKGIQGVLENICIHR